MMLALLHSPFPIGWLVFGGLALLALILAVGALCWLAASVWRPR